MKNNFTYIIAVAFFAYASPLSAQNPTDRAASAQMNLASVNQGIGSKSLMAQTCKREISAYDQRISSLKQKQNSSNQAFAAEIVAEENRRSQTQTKLDEINVQIRELETKKAKYEAELRSANAADGREKARNPVQPEGESLEEALKRNPKLLKGYQSK